MTPPLWPLAYPVDLITYDGRIHLRPEADLRRDMAAVREAGVTGVITGGLHLEESSSFDLAEAAARFRRLLTEYGLRLVSHHGIVPTFDEPGGDQAHVRARLLENVACCAHFGPTALVFHPGRKWGPHASAASLHQTYLATVARHGADAVLATAAANLKAMARAAAPLGLTVALENLGRFEPLAGLTTLPELVAAIDEPNAGFCIDSGHAHVFGESVPTWLEIAGAKLVATHFHDNHARGPLVFPPTGFVISTRQTDEHLPVGFGTIPWLEVIRTLRRIGYAGPISFETGGWPGLDAALGLRQAAAWWRAAERLAATSTTLTPSPARPA